MTVTDNPKPHVFDSFARGNINNLPQIGALNYEDFIKDYNIYFSSGELIPSNVLDQYCLRILGKTYGYESNPVPANENFYPNIWQGDGNTCAIDAQMIVLRDYGIFIPRSELVDYAVNHGWFNPDPERGGTQKQHVGNILDACDITTKRTEDANIYDIIAEIRAGHRVIVSVDADELWIKNEPNLFKKLFGNITNKVNDGVQKALGIEGANHALIVAGVNVNPNNPSDVKVTLIDSGSGEVCIEYNYKDFYNAWKDGKCLMVSTQVPAPYQYNYQTDMIEPSGIETQYIPSLITLPNEFNNEFKLDDSFYVHYSPEPIYTPNNPIWANVNTDYPCLDSSKQAIYAPSTNINHLTQNIGKHGDVANDITENHEAYDIHSDSTIDLIAHSGEVHMVDKPQSNEYAMIHIHGSDVHKHAIPETYVPPTSISDGFTTPTFEHHAGEYGIGTYTEVTGAHTYGYEAPESGETSVGNELDM